MGNLHTQYLGHLTGTRKVKILSRLKNLYKQPRTKKNFKKIKGCKDQLKALEKPLGIRTKGAVKRSDRNLKKNPAGLFTWKLKNDTRGS